MKFNFMIMKQLLGLWIVVGLTSFTVAQNKPKKEPEPPKPVRIRILAKGPDYTPEERQAMEKGKEVLPVLTYFRHSILSSEGEPEEIVVPVALPRAGVAGPFDYYGKSPLTLYDSEEKGAKVVGKVEIEDEENASVLVYVFWKNKPLQIQGRAVLNDWNVFPANTMRMFNMSPFEVAAKFGKKADIAKPGRELIVPIPMSGSAPRVGGDIRVKVEDQWLRLKNLVLTKTPGVRVLSFVTYSEANPPRSGVKFHFSVEKPPESK